MTAKSAQELIQAARKLSQEVAITGPVSLDALRLEAKTLFDRLPEPPSFPRQGDKAPEQASALIPPAVQLLARLMAISPDALTSRNNAVETAFHFSALSEEKRGDLSQTISRLVLATEAFLRALSAIANGDIVEGDFAADEVQTLARKALREGERFRFLGSPEPRPVYDSLTDTSRFDPDDSQKITFQVCCPACGRLGQFTVSSLVASHALTCQSCKSSLYAVIGYAAALHATDHGIKVHYSLSLDLLGEPRRFMEFDDKERKSLISASPNDLVAFVYGNTRALMAFENLTTGVRHVVKR